MRLSEGMKRRISEWAERSVYRLNARTADCYAFTLYRKANGKLDFSGGWDWQDHLIDKHAQGIYDLKGKRFLKGGV